ncbi:HK97-gp10 family putative phage morphogenesis protein [Phocoenobacter skyensis]|uniref:Phage protein, HK97 gp10 family n=1 Tax=Phocoenobacter skyensis TaxID=97481 RepID=A0A1H8A405_9PAST|nr:HK97-gp10 family putative phage morphogenesis protein [Pasteurella skyensis]QLB23324.1 hypothetical protein A6B44_08940 [Pasteurella skyensis]SEM65475.1 phage protein, HK97 gp10 family [Pasteurella skyensis]
MNKLKQIERQMRNLSKVKIKVGILPESGEYSSGISVAQVAIFNEFGTSKAPPRPFMRQTLGTSKDKLTKYQRKMLKQLQNESLDINSITENIGRTYVRYVKNEISEGNFVENAPATIRKKGHGRPLIDTRKMYRSINWSKL